MAEKKATKAAATKAAAPKKEVKKAAPKAAVKKAALVINAETQVSRLVMFIRHLQQLRRLLQ